MQDLKEQIELDRTAKMERESHYKNLLEDRDKTIDKLRGSVEREQSSAKLTTESELVNECGEDQQKSTTANDNSNEIIKNMKILMVKYKEIMKSQNEQIKMINDENERLKSQQHDQQHPKVTTNSDNDTKRLNDLLSELNEKDTFYKEQIKFMQTGYASEIDNMKMNNDELVQNISLLKTKLQSAQDDLTRLNENYTSLFRNFETKESDMRALEDKINSLEADRNECVKKVECLNENKQRDEKDHKDRINELVRVHIHDIAVKDADRDGLMIKIYDLENEVSDLNGKIGCLVAEKVKELETYEEKTKTLLNDLGNVHEISLHTLKTRSNELEGQLEQVTQARCDDISRLEKAISELTDEKASLNKRIQVLIEDKSEMTSKAHIELQEKEADWNRVKAQLEKENSNLTRKIEVVMENTAKSLDEQTTMLTKKIDVLETDRLEQIKRIDELESKLSQAENELTVRSASINGLDGKLGDLERERVELASRLESLTQNELKAVRQKLTETSDHAKQLEIKCASLENDNFDLSRRIDSLVEECAKHNKTAIELEQELNKKRDAESKRLEGLDQAESEKSQLTERAEALIEEKTKLLEKIESLNNELVQKQARLDDLEMEIGRIEREKCDLNGKLGLLTSENATRESISVKTERELNEKCEEINRLEDQLKQANDVNHTLSEQIERLKEENSKEFTAFQEKLKCLDRLDEVHANEIDEKNANIGRLVTQVHELEAQNSILSSRIENIIAEKAEISSYYEQEKQNTATLKCQIDATNQTHSNRTVMLEKQLSDMQETVSKLNYVEARLVDAQAQNTALNADVASMLTKISKLETEITEKQESICKLNDSLGNLRSLLDAEKETSSSQINAVNAKLGELSVKIENEIEAKNVLNEKLVESSSIIGELRADQQFYLSVLGLVEEKFLLKKHLANKNLAEIENKVSYYFTELAEMRESLKGENEALLKSISNENSKINNLNSLFEAQKQKLEVCMKKIN